MFTIHAYKHINGFIQLDICDKLHRIWTFWAKFPRLWGKIQIYGGKVQLSNFLHAYTPASSFVIDAYEHMNGSILLDISDKLHRIWTFWAEISVYGEKFSFMGKKVEFFHRIIFYMHSYLFLCLQFMLFNTYMDLFN